MRTLFTIVLVYHALVEQFSVSLLLLQHLNHLSVVGVLDRECLLCLFLFLHLLRIVLLNFLLHLGNTTVSVLALSIL